MSRYKTVFKIVVSMTIGETTELSPKETSLKFTNSYLQQVQTHTDSQMWTTPTPPQKKNCFKLFEI
uniref:Uncharacterized protein n=1 Tax=Anguilla anguilla TaxID=7936 RepID=A0A0E9X0J3_ANGAN